MPNTKHTRNTIVHEYIVKTKPWLPLFAVWGAEWMIVSLIAVIGEWKFPDWLNVALLGLAVLVSIFILLRSTGASDKRSKTAGQTDGGVFSGSGFIVLLPALLLAGTVLLLEGLHAVDPYFRELFRSLLVSFFYVQLGVFAGRSFIYLGLWLFALSAIIGTFYIGFSIEVLGLFGGASLIACGWLLGRIARTAAAPTE
ncbi:hypothetical protein [Paenibacillus contaminans]|nr:hypothetical protein [Paenibacillus contaminans]